MAGRCRCTSYATTRTGSLGHGTDTKGTTVDQADAHDLVAILHAEWPKGEWLDDDGNLTVRGALFASEFMPFKPEDGAEAVQRLRRRITFSLGPQSAEVVAALREVQHERDLSARMETLALEDGIAASPDEARDIIRGYFERVGRPVEYETKRAAAMGDKEAKIEAGRMLARRHLAEKADPAPRPVTEVLAGVRNVVQPLTACGVRWGTRMVENEAGAMVCPNCGHTAEEGCG